MSITSTEISQAIEESLMRSLSDVESDVSALFSTHQYDQPYLITCAECGGSLECSSSVDDDLDITIEVQPCVTCLKEAADNE